LGEVIQTSELRKRFGATRALDGLNLSVGAGEVHGFLGPNGAGKTTTIRILLGLIRPTAGAGHVLGRAFGSVESRKELGFLPDSPNFYQYLTARELLDFAGKLHGIASPERARRMDA
jgi:ABC-2 type transport system ATP-binding protein